MTAMTLLSTTWCRHVEQVRGFLWRRRGGRLCLHAERKRSELSSPNRHSCRSSFKLLLVERRNTEREREKLRKMSHILHSDFLAGIRPTATRFNDPAGGKIGIILKQPRGTYPKCRFFLSSCTSTLSTSSSLSSRSRVQALFFLLSVTKGRATERARHHAPTRHKLN